MNADKEKPTTETQRHGEEQNNIAVSGFSDHPISSVSLRFLRSSCFKGFAFQFRRSCLGNLAISSDPRKSAVRFCPRFLRSGPCFKGFAFFRSVLSVLISGKFFCYFAAQSFRPVSATLAMSHLPSARTRLNKSVPQWSTLPSTRKSNGAHTTARSLSMRTSGS